MENRDINKLIKRLISIREKMLNMYPFFGTLAMNLRFAVASCGTACTDMRSIIVDPDFITELNDDELMFILMHEVMHCVLKHPSRGKDKVKYLYNVACDIVVNSNILESMGLPEFKVAGEPAMHLAPSGQEGRNYSAEEVYYQLLGKVKIQLEKNGLIYSESNLSKTLDDHRIWESVSLDKIENDKWDSSVDSLAKKGYGTTLFPQSVRDIYEEAQKYARLKWKELLKDFITLNVFFTDYSFAPPDRRFSDSEYLLPGENLYETEELQHIWFCVDTSASISEEQLTRLYGEVMNVVKEIPNCKGLVSFFDTEITEPVSFVHETDFSGIEPTGGGGTNFQLIFDYLSEHMLDNLPNAIVILTDGYAAPVEEKCALSVPVMWILIDNEANMEWGKTVHIETRDI